MPFTELGYLRLRITGYFRLQITDYFRPSESEKSISFEIKGNMIVMTVFLSILNQMEFDSVRDIVLSQL